MNEYAVYKGDEFIIVGTLKECADRLNISEHLIKYYSYPSWKKRADGTNKILVERLDDDA